ncbi:hypothetical protein FB45DRAFT_1001111 [Roridomyces roridus]|uniref:Uncharacterized protein n=1 Tax=Roridomyces roridus TaxID=1738132 RepID=A0AAD7C706_9AGAR|nr:hypothetical protein FB45DRAFT_1001111 [Roridomyces roridus]
MMADKAKSSLSSPEASPAISPPLGGPDSETLDERKERLRPQRNGIIIRMRAAIEAADDCEPAEVAAPFRAELTAFQESLTEEDHAALNQPVALTKEQIVRMEAGLRSLRECL